jgi:hypothetical protein
LMMRMKRISKPVSLCVDQSGDQLLQDLADHTKDEVER